MSNRDLVAGCNVKILSSNFFPCRESKSFIGKIGKYLRCDGGDNSYLVSFNEGGEWWFYRSDLELVDDEKVLETSTKTYTLTPYIKPETVTINGVEYIMTENV